jgi:hypothetical protein
MEERQRSRKRLVLSPFLFYCVGSPVDDRYPRCGHSAAMNLGHLPDWQWPDILAHLKCTKCGSVGWVDPSPNWGEFINYNKGVRG